MRTAPHSTRSSRSSTPTCANGGRTRMLDEANLRRLAEMGIDVYVPRVAAARAAKAAPAAAPAVADPLPAVAAPSSVQPISRAHADAPVAVALTEQAAVVVLADTTLASANALVT